MTSWNMFRARATRVLANLIVIAGFMAVMPLILRAFLPDGEATPLLALVPELPAGLAQVQHIAWIPGGLAMPTLLALGGLSLMLVGSAIASRQIRLLEAERRRRENGLRRAYLYRIDARIEPTLRPQTQGGHKPC
jgi:hypothetical protein